MTVSSVFRRWYISGNRSQPVEPDRVLSQRFYELFTASCAFTLVQLACLTNHIYFYVFAYVKFLEKSRLASVAIGNVWAYRFLCCRSQVQP